MSSKTYLRRKAAGVCVWCEAKPRPGNVYCDACVERINHYRTQRRYARVPHLRLPVLRPPLPPTPGVVTIACCGREHPVTQVPFRTVCCGRVFGVGEEPS